MVMNLFDPQYLLLHFPQQTLIKASTLSLSMTLKRIYQKSICT